MKPYRRTVPAALVGVAIMALIHRQHVTGAETGAAPAGADRVPKIELPAALVYARDALRKEGVNPQAFYVHLAQYGERVPEDATTSPVIESFGKGPAWAIYFRSRELDSEGDYYDAGIAAIVFSPQRVAILDLRSSVASGVKESK